MSKKKYAIIQARMDSSRLPNKVLKKIGKYPMLHYVIKQTLAAKSIDEVIIVTTKTKSDDKIIEFCKKNEIKFYRGSKNDLLDRYYQCAKKFQCDPIIRITSDCPLIDPNVIDKIIKKFEKNEYDYVANNLEKINGKWNNSMCNFPQGMTVEISSFKVLKIAWKKAKKHSEREHVFPYIQFNTKYFKISKFKMKQNLSHIRCTVDRKEDLMFVRSLYNKIGYEKIISIKDIVKIVNKEPKLVLINNKIPFDEGYKKSILMD